MLKWKRLTVTADDADEEIIDALAGMSGKNRVIKYLAELGHEIFIRLRVYRDAEQIVDFDCAFLSAETSLLPMDLPLAEGQLCKIGIYNGAAEEKTYVIAIGYEETG